MPGAWINHQQLEIYMKSRKSGCTQETASAKAGISERSGRNIEKGRRQDPRTKNRHWSTRKDPLEKVWESDCVAMLESSPKLDPMTLLEYLQDKYVNEKKEAVYTDSVLRTLQRRVKQWKALHGPAIEVMFRQKHEPGRLGLSDFTHLKDVVITINGKPLPHILYHFRLAYSHWSHMKVILGGESFTALAEGLQEALWRLGGSPLIHRTDSLSAAFKNLTSEARQDFTDRYSLFCDHYNMQATRNNLGEKHENGSVESAHGHLKRRIKQAILLRGSNDFESVEYYQSWLDGVVNQHNRRNAKALSVERDTLQNLPAYKTTDYTQLVAKVTSSSTIDVRKVTYTVPSQLQGEALQIRLYHNRLECFLGQRVACTLVRVYPTGKTTRARKIDYRHVIHSLVKKPQAFRFSQIKNELLPTPTYHKIWDHIDKKMEPRQACKFIVGILHLAATQDCEQSLGQYVMDTHSKEKAVSLTQLQEKFGPEKAVVPQISISQHALRSYDTLVPLEKETAHG